MNFKIKTHLWSGILMGALSIWLLLSTENQVRVPAFDSGAPSPRIIPYIVLVLMLVSSIGLIVQSLVFKKDKEVDFDWTKEKPIILLILGLCIYVAMINFLGFVISSLIVFPLILFYCGERKPGIYVFTIAIAVGIYLLFQTVFHVSLPTFPFL